MLQGDTKMPNLAMDMNILHLEYHLTKNFGTTGTTFRSVMKNIFLVYI